VGGAAGCDRLSLVHDDVVRDCAGQRAAEAARGAGELRPDVTAEDIAAALIGIFTVAPPPAQPEPCARRFLCTRT